MLWIIITANKFQYNIELNIIIQKSLHKFSQTKFNSDFGTVATIAIF